MVVAVCIALFIAAIVGYNWANNRQNDDMLDCELEALVARARSELPQEDSVRLRSNLMEIQQKCLTIARSAGMKGAEATRMMRVEEIRAITIALEVHNMMSKPIIFK